MTSFLVVYVLKLNCGETSDEKVITLNWTFCGPIEN